MSDPSFDPHSRKRKNLPHNKKTDALRQCVEVLLELCLQKIDVLQDLGIRPLA